MRTKRTIPLALALVLALPFAATAGNDAPGDGDRTVMRDQAPMMGSTMTGHHQEMVDRMTSMDADLERLVADVRSTTGDAKVDALAALVEELVAQRRAMQETMVDHRPMMGRAMGPRGEGPGMGDCPMMGAPREEDASSPPSGDEHSEHHAG